MGLKRISFCLLIIVLSLLLTESNYCQAKIEVSQAQTSYSEVDEKDTPIFLINLNLKPEDRWREVVSHFAPQIKITANAILPRIPWYLKLAFWISHKVMENTPYSFNGFGGLNRESYSEFVGIAKELNMEIYEVMISNFEYELLAACTSIVANQAGAGIVHGRNMDYLLYKFMEDITYKAEFYYNEVKIYDAIMFAGYTGVFTAMKTGQFAISINERRPRALFGIFFNVASWILHAPSPAMLLRKACEHTLNYTEAKNMLINHPITAPVYFTISGTERDEGAIITRDRLSAADVWELKFQSPTDWVIVQTNYDHWISPAPAGDNNRADTAKELLRSLEFYRVHESSMMSEIIQKSPIKNRGTIYSTVMNAKKVRVIDSISISWNFILLIS